jgi:hypothetical protein
MGSIEAPSDLYGHGQRRLRCEKGVGEIFATSEYVHLRELYSTNVTAKIIRTATRHLKNNVSQHWHSRNRRVAMLKQIPEPSCSVSRDSPSVRRGCREVQNTQYRLLDVWFLPRQYLLALRENYQVPSPRWSWPL